MSFTSNIISESLKERANESNVNSTSNTSFYSTKIESKANCTLKVYVKTTSPLI